MNQDQFATLIMYIDRRIDEAFNVEFRRPYRSDLNKQVDTLRNNLARSFGFEYDENRLVPYHIPLAKSEAEQTVNTITLGAVRSDQTISYADQLAMQNVKISTPSEPEPELKTYQLWTEGFNDMGNIQPACYHGTAEGTSFADACARKFKGDKYYQEKGNSYYTKLHDNETDARKAYG